ncbi:aspartate carbamoyltransferase, partial [Staphylococcus condimenti]
MKQLVSMEDLTNEEIYSLIETAIEYKKGNK